MNITPETKRLSELLPIEGELWYKIPIYQRDYSWKTAQIDQLFLDIKNEASGYYLGNLLVTENESNHPEIVDGQQRMVTLALFLLAIFERLSDFHETPADIAKSAATQSDILRKLIHEDKPRIKLLKRDAQIFEDYLRILEGEQYGRWGKYTFGKRYAYIRTLFDEEEFDTLENLLGFYAKINAIEILRITVVELSDAFSVFSSLNSKGLPLTLIDLLKNEFLRTADQDGVDVEKALVKWDRLIGIFCTDESEANQRAVTQFLLNNYDAFEGQSGSSITRGRALSKYSALLSQRRSTYIDTLIKRAQVFVQFIGLSDDSTLPSETRNRLHVLNELDSSQAYPLLLLLFVNQKDLKVTPFLDEVLNVLINFFIRRNVVLKPKASNIRARMMRVVRSIKTEGLKGREILDRLQHELNSISASDEEFKIALSDPIYENYSTTRQILISLEREYGTFFDKSNPDSLDEFLNHPKGQRRWTVEHILPQGELPDAWKSILSPDTPDDAVGIQNEFAHKLGNLTLTPFNPELSQKVFVEKRDYKKNGKLLGLQMPLFLNSSLADTENGETLSDKTTWTAEDIARRTDKLADLVVEMYPT